MLDAGKYPRYIYVMINVHINLDDELLDRIDSMAKLAGINRSLLLRLAAKRLLDDTDAGTAVLRLDPVLEG